MKNKIFNTPFSRSIIPWNDWHQLTDVQYNRERAPTVFPGKAGDKGLVETRKLKPRPKGSRGCTTRAYVRRQWDLLNFDGLVSVKCCNKLHTMRLEKNLTLTCLHHDDLDSLRMMQTFGDGGSLRCLEITDAWNNLVKQGQDINIILNSWEIRQNRDVLPKDLRCVYDHFRSVFSFERAAGNLTSRRKQYSGHRAVDIGSLEYRMNVRIKGIVEKYAEECGFHWFAYRSSTNDRIEWFKTVWFTGLTKVYLESEWREYVGRRDLAEKYSPVPNMQKKPVVWPVFLGSSVHGTKVVLAPKVNRDRPTHYLDTAEHGVYSVEPRACGYLGNIYTIKDNHSKGEDNV